MSADMFTVMLNDFERLFESPAVGLKSALDAGYGSCESTARGSGVGVSAADSIPDCTTCNDSGRRFVNGCYTTERCWCVAGDAYERQEEIQL